MSAPKRKRAQGAPEKKKRVRHTDAAIERALRACGGLVAHAAETLGMSGWGLRRRLAASESLRAARAEAIEDTLDLCESKLVELVRANNLGAIIFTLKTLGRSRGYVERQEVETTNPQPLHVYIPQRDEPIESQEHEPLATIDDRGSEEVGDVH